MVEVSTLKVEKHIMYWKRCLKTYLPAHYTPMDSNRMMLGFFIVSALDLLGCIEESLKEDERAGFIDWIYHCQHRNGGFRGFTGTDFGELSGPENEAWDPAHLAATYFALATLLVLGDDLSRVNRRDCLIWLAKMQRADGSFGESLGVDGRIEGTMRVRFGYCAAAVRSILRPDDNNTNIEKNTLGAADIDVNALLTRIKMSQAYDGGYSENPFHEAHAGFSYCAIAGLSLVRGTSPDEGLPDREHTIKWLLSRQTDIMVPEDFLRKGAISKIDDPNIEGDNDNAAHIEETLHHDVPCAGFNGRCNKLADTCYAFWVGASLSILGQIDLINSEASRLYLIRKTQHLIGGFGKTVGDPPDIYHSYLGLAALSLLKESSLRPLNAPLCISERAAQRVESLPWHMGPGISP